MKEKTTCCAKYRRLVNVLTMREKRRNVGALEHSLLSPSKRKLFNKIQNEKKCLKKKVALIFMWQSLGSNFSLTIGVFASK